MKGKIDGPRLFLQIKTVETFFDEIRAMQSDDGRGNLAIGFIAQPRTFSLHVSGTEGEFTGSGSTLMEAMKALVESLKRQ